MFVWKEIPQVLEEDLWPSSTQVQIHWGSPTPFSSLPPSVTHWQFHSSPLAHQTFCGTLTLPTHSHEAAATHSLHPVRARLPKCSFFLSFEQSERNYALKLHQTGYFTPRIWSTHESKYLSHIREKRLTISAGLRCWEERLSSFTVSYTRGIWPSEALSSSSASTRRTVRLMGSPAWARYISMEIHCDERICHRRWRAE